MGNSVEKLFQEYLDEIRYSARLRPETIRGYLAVFTLLLKIMPEIVDLKSLTPEMLTEFFKRIETRTRIVGKTLKSGVKKSTIKTLRSKLNVFFVWLQKKSYIQENPLDGIRPPQVNYDDFRRLNDGDINKIYAAIACDVANPLMNRRDLMMVSILLFCGLRKGELISLQMKDVDLINEQITVRGETSKSKRTRVLKMHPTLVMHVKLYVKERRALGLKTEHLIVTTKKDAGLTRHGLQHWVKRLIINSGVRFHLHQFRHTFACKLAEKDVNLFKIQKMMGHTDITMTMKYGRSMQTEDMADDIAKISF